MRWPAKSGRAPSSPPRDLHKSMWRWTSHLTVTLGVLCGVARWGWAVAFAFVVITFCAGSVAACFLEDGGLSAAPRVTRIAVWTGLTAIAVSALVVVLGFVGVLLLLLVAAMSPVVRFCVATRWFTAVDRSGSVTAYKPESAPATTELAPGRSAEPRSLRLDLDVMPPEDVHALDDAALCLAWRRSFTALDAARTPSDHLTLVATRELYLDELQRRYPHGVESWLASGARAASNPMPFLGRERRADR
jgi:hypothetical protein